MKKTLFAILLILTTVCGAQAQSDYALQIETDKKILNIDKLGLPESATIYEALSILPELLGRTKDAILLYYDIKIDGFSLGSAYEGTLSQIRLSQVKKIEIVDSAIDSYKNNGQGGSINIFLNDMEIGYSGEASLATFSLMDVKPMVVMGYKKNGLVLRAMAEFDYYQPFDVNSRSQGYVNGKEVPYTQTDSVNKKSISEAVRILMEYSPNDKDVFKLRFSEFCGWDQQNQFIDTKNSMVYSKKEKQYSGKKLSIDLNSKFQHTFDTGSKVSLEATYSYSPNDKFTAIPEYNAVSSENLGTSISGKIEYEHHFMPKKEQNFSNLIFGVNNNIESYEQYHMLSYDSRPNDGILINSVVHNWFISPYLKYDAKLGQWRLKAEFEYQSFNYKVRSMSNDKFNKSRGDVIGKAMAGWQINGSNHIQFIVDRKLERPGGNMLYPYITFNPDDEKYEYGNPDIKPMTINSLSLNYITNGKSGPHSYVINAEISYKHVRDMLTVVKGDTDFRKVTYYTFANKGVNNVFAAEVSALYKVGILSLSFSGNLYDNHQSVDGSEDDYTYYNLSLFPTVNFKKGWNASAKLTYHSRITTSKNQVGAVTTLSFSAGKDWGRFAAYVMGVLPLSGDCQDIIQGEGLEIRKTYKYLNPYAGLTLNYEF